MPCVIIPHCLKVYQLFRNASFFDFRPLTTYWIVCQGWLMIYPQCIEQLFCTRERVSDWSKCYLGNLIGQLTTIDSKYNRILSLMFLPSFFTLNRKSKQLSKCHSLINFISVKNNICKKTFFALLFGSMKIQTYVLFIFQSIPYSLLFSVIIIIKQRK